MSKEDARWWREQAEKERTLAADDPAAGLAQLVKLVLKAEQRRLTRIQRVDAPYWSEWKAIVAAARALEDT